MKPFNQKIEMLKLLSLPIGILILSYLGFLAVKFQYTQESDSQTSVPLSHFRAPASLSNAANVEADIVKKVRLEKAHADTGFKKPHGALEIAIESQNIEDLLDGSSTELTGTFKVDRDISQVEIVWHLPAGIEHLEGAQKKTFLNLRAGEQQSFKIKVISHSNDNKQIHLEASYINGPLKVGGTSQYNRINQPHVGLFHVKNKHSETERVWQ
jgi:hypothetical protein